MDKYRTRSLCKPAKHRPMFHFPFGDKYARRERRQDRNVQITQMIAGELTSSRTDSSVVFTVFSLPDSCARSGTVALILSC